MDKHNVHGTTPRNIGPRKQQKFAGLSYLVYKI